MNPPNPLQMMMQMGQTKPNPLSQLLSMGSTQRQPIDQQKFRAAASQLDKHTLANLVVQARQQGISEQEIESGLNFLLKLR